MKRFLHSVFILLCLTSVAMAVQVIVPDNGNGTAAMPIGANYDSLSPMQIVNGLPVGSQINIDAVLNAPVVSAEQPGGTLLGTKSGGGGPLFTWIMQGTGVLASYSRTLSFPPSGPGGVLSFPDPAFNVIGASYEVHAAPRTLNAPIQSFDTDMFRMFSQITGDPDFDLLRVTGGTDFGMPSPGHTTLTSLGGGNWNVDSFFDITYRIDFVGKPGGPFGGMSGSTTGTARFQAGEPVPEPGMLTLLGGGAMILAGWMWRRKRN
jgi:hypothetical protein